MFGEPRRLRSGCGWVKRPVPLRSGLRSGSEGPTPAIEIRAHEDGLSGDDPAPSRKSRERSAAELETNGTR